MVEILRFCGWPIERIAAGMGCSENTLRERFSDELEFGADRKHAQLVEALFRAAERGSAAAARFIREQGFDAGKEKRHRRRRPPLLGKKARAERDAHTAGVGTEWGELLDEKSRLN